MPDLRPVLYVLGLLLIALAGAMLLPALIDMLDGNPDWRAFLASAGLSATAGGGMALAFRPSKPIELTHRAGFLLTTLSWLVIAAFAAPPFMLAGTNLDLVDAFFEAMSGITTTGSSVISDIDNQSMAIKLWRSMLQMLGGIGIVVMAVAVLPLLRVGGMQLFRAESSDKSEKIRPRVSQVSGIVVSIILVLTAVCALALMLAGMPVFDAVCHAMTTVATAGFSTKAASLGAYPSPLIHWIITVFMFIGGMAFILLIQVSRGRFSVLLRDTQLRWYAIYIGAFILAMTLWQVVLNDRDFWSALTASAFNVVSIATTTGFASEDFLAWGSLPVAGFMVLMFIGGCTGSTSGGIKVFRYCILGGVAHGLLRNLVHPHRVQQTTYNGRPVGDDVIRSVLGFFFFYMAAFAILTLVFSLFVGNLTLGLSAVGQALGNVGPGLVPSIGPVGHFGGLPDGAKWVLSLAMLLGRLELLTILVLFLPTFWRG
ncbi:MAG: TrkH family potassium uptake protein [Dongiaceae bacterium]